MGVELTGDDFEICFVGRVVRFVDEIDFGDRGGEDENDFYGFGLDG